MMIIILQAHCLALAIILENKRSKVATKLKKKKKTYVLAGNFNGLGKIYASVMKSYIWARCPNATTLFIYFHFQPTHLHLDPGTYF